jgi:biopolymer transport protein ExbB
MSSRFASIALASLIVFALASSALAQASAPADATAPAPAVAAPPATSPPPAATAQAGPIAPDRPAQETVENPYSLTALWRGGDVIARGTIVILAIMSMASWYVMITKFIEQAVLQRQAGAAERSFWTAPSIREGAEALAQRSAFRMVIENGLEAVQHHEGRLTEQIDRHTWITMSLQRSVENINNRLQSGLAVLATVGSTAPFVGLFGTVWGIYHALTAIGIAGQASIDKVAGPVGEALIMTAIGLAVAVPAVLGYNWMVRRNKVTMDRVRNFSGDLLALLVGGARTSPLPAAKRA